MENNRTKYLDMAYAIIRDILKNWITVFCVALSAALIAQVVLAMLYVPQYTSRCTMVVSAKVNNNGVYTDANETEKLTDTINAVLNSNVLKKKTAESLGMQSFDGEITINILPQTNLLEVSVTSLHPATSFKLLSALLQIYPELSKDILGDVVMDIFEEPSFPAYPSNSLNTRRITNWTILVASCVVMLLFGVYSYYIETVKSKWDAEDKLDAKLLGVLYHERHYRNLKSLLLRKKKRLLLGSVGVSFDFCESIKKIRTKLSFFQEKAGDKILLVTSYDEKEGKTLLSANLACAMALRKQKVLVVSGYREADSLAETMNITVEDDFFKKEKKSFAECIFSDKSGYLNVFVYPKFSSDEAFSKFIDSKKFSVFLQGAREVFDYIVIDGPSAVNHADTEVLAGLADCSVLVVKQNYSRITLINDTIDMLNGYNSGLAGYVLNDVHTASKIINLSYGYGYNSGYGYGGYRYGYGKYNKYSYGYYNHYDKQRQDKESTKRDKG